MRGCVVKSSENNYLVMNRIMLRFRPIAPKPTGGVKVSDAADLEKRNESVKRTKRKYVRVRCRQSKSKFSRESGKSSLPAKSAAEESSLPGNGFVTLQLLPDRSESEKICSGNITVEKIEKNRVNQLTLQDELTGTAGGVGGGAMELSSFRSTIDTWIIVERVTETVTENGVGLGFTDRDRIGNLQADTCPGFVSDCTNKVVWFNNAYREMVAAAEDAVVAVWLVVKETLPHFCPSFACRVRVIQHTRQGQKWNRIVPCDVWRMEFDGFAWKLDVNTALTLGI